MTAIRKISHVGYTTPDMERQIEYYTEVLGLARHDRAGDTVYLGGKLDPHSVVLRKGDKASCTTIAFQIGPEDDLNEMEAKIKGHGVATTRESDSEPGMGDCLVFEDSKGTRIEIFQQTEATDTPFTGKGIQPHKLGHVAFHVEDVKKATEFYCDVMGFRVSDWMSDFFSFLRCNTDHHTINLIGTGRNAHFHTAFELRDWGHMQQACDFLMHEGYRQIWGPGRHGIGHNLFCYHQGPNGMITELFAELDQVDEVMGCFQPRPWHKDNPQKPKVWPKDPTASNLWGPQPPENMFAL